MGGSYEEALAFAQDCMKVSSENSFAELLLFEAVYEHWYYCSYCSEDEEQALLNNPEIQAMLNQAFATLIKK